MEFHKILVPINGTLADDEAMKLACRLAKKDKSKISAVYVITLKRTLPLEAEITSEIKKAEDMLDHIEEVAEEMDCEVVTSLLQARDAAPAIIDEVVERKVDLILMGVPYKTHFGQFSMGSIIPYMLKNAPCPVMLYHQPVP